jgi:hypothetical protein
LVVLHETAHSILLRHSSQDDGHGKVFAALVLELWARFAGVPKGAARTAGVHQKPRRVRFATKVELDRALRRR